MAEAPVPSPYSSSSVVNLGVILGISVSSSIVLPLVFLACRFRKQLKSRFLRRYTYPGPGLEDKFEEETQTRMTKNFTGVDVSTVDGGTQSRLTADVVRERKHAHRRARKQVGLISYINKVLRLLFALSGLFTIFFSVILENSFHHRPVRFTAFGILTPVTIILGLLASGWFPRIPLWFIACVKRRGFLKHVMPCSPWHDNVVTDFSGDICTLEPLKPLEPLEHGELSQLSDFVQVFLFGTSSHGSISSTPSTLDPDPGIQDLEEAASTVDSQLSLPNLQEALPPVGHIVVQIDRSSMFYVSDDERVPMLTIEGPEINGLPLKVEAFKNTSTRDPTFDLSCIFRDKRTRRMYLTGERLRYLAQNMLQWVANPHPIVVDASSDILHCMAIQDILWEFTRGLYTIKSVHVEHRFLAGMVHIRILIIMLYVIACSALSLIPLLSDKKSYFFLFFLVVVVPYLFTLDDTDPLSFYNFRSFLCPIFIKIRGFRTLYTCRSLFRWCNEFRKERVLNPAYFWIDEQYSNRLSSDGESLFSCSGFVELLDSRKSGSFVMTYQADPTRVGQIQHAYKLRVNFDTVKASDTCYENVSLIFCEHDDEIGRLNCSAIEMKRVGLIEKLFHRYSDPNFGGYVEAICPGFWHGTYLGHSPRFLDICHKIINEETIPSLLVASRMPGSKFIIGVPFWSSRTVDSESSKK